MITVLVESATKEHIIKFPLTKPLGIFTVWFDTSESSCPPVVLSTTGKVAAGDGLTDEEIEGLTLGLKLALGEIEDEGETEGEIEADATNESLISNPITPAASLAAVVIDPPDTVPGLAVGVQV